MAKTLQEQLEAPYTLTEVQIEQFQRDGYIKLKHVVSPEVIELYGREITEQVFRLNRQTKPLSERDTYGQAFLQVTNLWEHSDAVKRLSFSKRLARIAAELMGVAGVRMYHDQALYKEAGGGFTPWHADQYYWPLSNSNTVTAWIPLQETPREMGPLAFSIGSQTFEAGRNLGISDDSERKIGHSLKDMNYPMDDTPYDLGEVSYHYGWTFHRAGPNTTSTPRKVLTIIYMEDGIRLAEPKNKNQIKDWEVWMPGTKVGEVVDTHLNPVLYRAE